MAEDFQYRATHGFQSYASHWFLENKIHYSEWFLYPKTFAVGLSHGEPGTARHRLWRAILQELTESKRFFYSYFPQVQKWPIDTDSSGCQRSSLRRGGMQHICSLFWQDFWQHPKTSRKPWTTSISTSLLCIFRQHSAMEHANSYNMVYTPQAFTWVILFKDLEGIWDTIT